MNESTPLPRRTFLRGLGTAMALPLLPSLLPARALLAGEGRTASAPNRMAFLYVPNGVHMQAWTPTRSGFGYDLPSILEPLAPFREELNVLSGLTADKARANGDGPGDHARSAAAFLTGVQPRKTHGADIRAGISVDQVAAGQIGRLTRLPSLELGCDAGQQAGNCDSGYSCAYSSNISWKTESMPMAKEINPRLVFERLFSNGVKGEVADSKARRERRRKSILDFVMEDADRLRPRLALNDQRKIDEYFSSVREVERRLDAARPGGDAPAPAGAKPDGIPRDYAEHIRLMCDMIVLAFQADVTRIVTFLIANEGSNKSYRFIEVPDGHHDLSHHGGNREKQEKIRKINTFHVTQLAYLLGRLKSVQEEGGTLLDHSMIVYGSAIGDGNRHNHDNLPILLAGRGCGTIQSGRHVTYPRNTPLNNLYLSLLDRIDARADTLGDSTGRLPGLFEEDRSF